MKKLLAILLVFITVSGIGQTRVEDLIQFPWTLRKVVNATDSVFNTFTAGGISEDTLKVINQNTTGVYTRTSLDTLETKMSLYDYSLNIGSSNDTIVLVDPLDWKLYNGDTTSVINTIKWYNTDNTSELVLKYNDSILPYDAGIVDVTKANNITLIRDANSGTFIDQCVRIMTSPSAKPVIPSAPLYVSGSAEIGTVGDSIFTLDFDQNINITDTTGFSFTCTGDTVYAHTISAGSGTSAINIALNRAVISTDTITFSISGTNTITGVVGGLSFAGVTDSAVVNNTSDGIISLYEFTSDFTDSKGTNNLTNSGTTLSGGEAVFDGSTSYLTSLSLLAEFRTATVRTICFAVTAVNDIPTLNGTFVAFGDTDANTYINIVQRVTGGEIQLGCIVSGTTIYALRTDNQIFTAGVQAHIDIVHDGTRPYIYVNGVLVAQTFVVDGDRTLWLNDMSDVDNLNIGRNYFNSAPTQYYDGSLDNLTFYNIVTHE